MSHSPGVIVNNIKVPLHKPAFFIQTIFWDILIYMDFVKRGHLSFIIRKIYTAGREPCRKFFLMSPNQKIMSPNTNDEPRTHLGELQLSLAGNHYFCQCRLLFISYIYLPVVIHPSFSSSVKLVDAIEDMSFQCSLHIVAVWRKI